MTNMRHTFCSVISLCILGISIANINIVANPIAPATQEPTQQHAPVTMLDDIVNAARADLDKIYSTLSMLSCMIADKEIGNIPRKNRKTVIETVRAINSLIQNVQRERFVQADLNTAYFLLQFNHELIKHISGPLNNSLLTLKPFDPSALFKRTMPKNIGPKEMMIQMHANKKALAVLEKSTDHAGLRWYNYMYRTFDKTIIAPSMKYSIPTRAATAAAIGGLSMYCWRLFDPKSFKNSHFAAIFDRKLFGKNLIGPAIEYNEIGHRTNALDLGWVGSFESLFSDRNRGLIPIFAALTGFATYQMYKEWQLFYPWFSVKLKVAHNKLKGGAYMREAQRADNAIDEIYFDDLVGLDHVKNYFSILVNYLEKPESFDRKNITPPKGILLIGETRTGKTYSVKALFGEIKRMLKAHGKKSEFEFLEIGASEINQYGIPYVLNLIKKCAPCILFIDEIDLLDLQRKGKNQTLSEFLTCMSGTLDTKDPKNQVIIIAATNQPESLDKALRQPGRFGKELRFELPSFKDRKSYIMRKLNKLSLNFDMFNVEKLTHETENKSYEALNILINNAVLKACIRGEIVNQQHIEDTLDEELRHVMNVNIKDVAAHEKRLLAIHFAGHALALKLLSTDNELSKVTIKPVMTDIKEEMMGMHLYQKDDADKQKRYEYGQVFTHHTFDTVNASTRDEKLKQCQFHLAGIVAEELLTGSCGYSCHTDDMKRVLTIAQSITFEGIEISILPKHAQKERFDQAVELKNEAKANVTALLEEHKDVLINLALALEKYESLSAEQVEQVIKLTLQTEEAPQHIVEQDNTVDCSSTEVVGASAA